MKYNFLLAVCLAGLFSGCKSPVYLPSYDKIDESVFGSYIRINYNSGAEIRGELLAVDQQNLVVLTEETNKCMIIPLSTVKIFSLRYAKPKQYGWTIPFAAVLPLIHGYYSLLTVPIHLIVTFSVTATGQNAFKYNDKQMKYDDLRMFARFPQGIPPNVDLNKIKRSAPILNTNYTME